MLYIAIYYAAVRNIYEKHIYYIAINIVYYYYYIHYTLSNYYTLYIYVLLT